MKNFSLALNIILLIAVAYLYYLNFSNKPVAPVLKGEGMPNDAIVFINSDSLLKEYRFFNDLKSELEAKEDSIDKLLKSRGQQLDKDVMAYQERAASMSPDKRMETEERLMGRQQQLMEMKQTLLEELHEKESAMSDSVHANLSRFLKDYNKDKGYLYILGYQRGSGILLAHDSLDITGEVLKGLNAK
jgi:outer membrane protein